MTTQLARQWEEANQRYLLAALALVRQRLEEREEHRQEQATRVEQLQRDLAEASSSLPAPASLLHLCSAFSLSSFERDLLLLCAGIELESDFRQLCSRLAAPEQTTAADVPFAPPTFALALATLANTHWDALTPGAPLRHWRLLTVRHGAALTLSPLSIDEPILHYLAGLPYQDERINALCPFVPSVEKLVPSHHALVQHVLALWPIRGELTLANNDTNSSRWPVIQLCGTDRASQNAVAASGCQQLNLRLRVLAAEMVPTIPGEIELFARLCEREAVLGRSILLLDCHELESVEKKSRRAVNALLQQMQTPVMLSCREQNHWLRLDRSVVTLDVPRPVLSEQRRLWQQTLDAHDIHLNGQLDRLAMQFNLNHTAILAASTQAMQLGGATSEATGEQIEARLWEACRIQARPALDDLAQRIESQPTWEDLILPDAQQQLLHEIAAHVRQRATVYETWGFGRKGARGLGISALFAGASGTGKTLAAEVLAHELRLDLYRIDLSSVVSKYIGETEKNLRRIFDAAEEGGAILLFDEADALFGKRSEVKDSHDRYANIEVSYLLQRVEAYRGLAILTTNLKSALDTAFLRRLRFIVQFPFPDAPMRTEIWRRIFPPELPVEDLDQEKLARLHIAGGNIRNIALHAAFLAADAHEPVKMAHLLRAATTEYAKLEKPLTEAEIGGWIS